MKNKRLTSLLVLMMTVIIMLVAALPAALPCTLFGHYGQMIPLLLCSAVVLCAVFYGVIFGGTKTLKN